MSAKLQQTPGGGEESMLAVDIEHGTNTHGKEERPKPVHEITETSLPHDKEARVPTPGDTEGSELQSLSRPEKWNTLQRAWNWKPSPARYDPENPPKFTIWLNVLFGFVCHHPLCFKFLTQRQLTDMATPGVVLHGRQSLLQSAHPQPHGRHLQRQL